MNEYSIKLLPSLLHSFLTFLLRSFHPSFHPSKFFHPSFHPSIFFHPSLHSYLHLAFHLPAFLPSYIGPTFFQLSPTHSSTLLLIPTFLLLFTYLLSFLPTQGIRSCNPLSFLPTSKSYLCLLYMCRLRGRSSCR